MRMVQRHSAHGGWHVRNLWPPLSEYRVRHSRKGRDILSFSLSVPGCATLGVGSIGTLGGILRVVRGPNVRGPALGGGDRQCRAGGRPEGSCGPFGAAPGGSH